MVGPGDGVNAGAGRRW